MKAIKLSCTLLLFLAIVTSCKRDCYRDLEPEEKIRLGYKGWETIVFKNPTTGKKDTMLTGAINKTITPGEGKCKDEKETFSVNGSFRNRLYSNINAITFSTQITAPDKDVSALVYPVITTSIGKFTINQSINRITTNINGVAIADVYELVNTQPVADPEVEKIYFTFNYGLVKIQLKNGQYWERINI